MGVAAGAPLSVARARACRHRRRLLRVRLRGALLGPRRRHALAVVALCNFEEILLRVAANLHRRLGAHRLCAPRGTPQRSAAGPTGAPGAQRRRYEVGSPTPLGLRRSGDRGCNGCGRGTPGQRGARPSHAPSMRLHARPWSLSASRKRWCSSSVQHSRCLVMVYGLRVRGSGAAPAGAPSIARAARRNLSGGLRASLRRDGTACAL